MDFPVSPKIVNFLIARDNQLTIKTHYTSLTRDSIIKKDSILVRINEATYIHFPGIMPEWVLLLLIDTKILFEVENNNIP